jgi:hypothetical protein
MLKTIMLAAVSARGSRLAATCSANTAKWGMRIELINNIAVSLITLGLSLTAINQAKASLIYWADQNTAGINRANLDGSQQQTLVTGQFSATGIALEVPADQMYWTRQGSGGDIRRANLDGVGQQILVGQVSPFGIALDTATGQCTGPTQVKSMISEEPTSMAPENKCS